MGLSGGSSEPKTPRNKGVRANRSFPTALPSTKQSNNALRRSPFDGRRAGSVRGAPVVFEAHRGPTPNRRTDGRQ